MTLKSCPYTVLELLGEAFKCYGIDFKSLLRELGLRLLCVSSDKYIEVLAVKYMASKLVEESEREGVLGGHLFSAGVHVARVPKRGGPPVPLLGALELLRGRITKGYVVVRGKGVEAFLYGRDVLQESVVALKPFDNDRCRDMPIVVLDEYNEPIGWGRLVKKRNKLMILNVLDLGWYLRCGV